MNTREAETVLLLGEEVSPEVEALCEQVSCCMQCGTCSGSCPSASRMDYTPRQVMLALQMGLEQQAVGCEAIWHCAACYMCTVRCPRGIAVSDVMAELRTINLQRGLAKQQDKVFVKSFLGIVRRYGRMFEPELLLRYHLLNNPLNLLKQASLALDMLKRGKIEFLPQRLQRIREVRQVFSTDHHEEGTA